MVVVFSDEETVMSRADVASLVVAIFCVEVVTEVVGARVVGARVVVVSFIEAEVADFAVEVCLGTLDVVVC